MGAELAPPGAASPPLPHPQAKGQGLGKRNRCSAPLLRPNPPGTGIESGPRLGGECAEEQATGQAWKA